MSNVRIFDRTVRHKTNSIHYKNVSKFTFCLDFMLQRHTTVVLNRLFDIYLLKKKSQHFCLMQTKRIISSLLERFYNVVKILSSDKK